MQSVSNGEVERCKKPLILRNSPENEIALGVSIWEEESFYNDVYRTVVRFDNTRMV